MLTFHISCKIYSLRWSQPGATVAETTCRPRDVLRFLKSAVRCWRPSILVCYFHGYVAAWRASCWIIHVWKRAAEEVRLYKAKLIKVAVLKVYLCLIQEERKERSVVIPPPPSVSLSLIPQPPSSSHFTYPPLPSAFSGKLQPDCSL